VKAGFRGAWKEIRQRSMVALSLILSLLLLKKACSNAHPRLGVRRIGSCHIQNIGNMNMLKVSFSQSQFIIVSLKEGMFNNTDVILRTTVVKGVSNK
jgi:structural maintenance of chromosome 2